MGNETKGDGQAIGCFASAVSALLTGLLLFLNGGLVLAVLNAVSSGGFPFLRDERFSQFAVLAGPVILVVIQWMMLDYLRMRFVRRRCETSEPRNLQDRPRK